MTDWHKKRITKEDLPLRCYVQYGEMFGDDIVWEETLKVATLVWKEQCNLDDEPGIVIKETGGWGYAGWDAERGIYVRYAELEGNEHCIRIALKK